MTSPIILPGWGSSLGNAASSIGQGIQQVVNPNFQFQQQFSQALANPQMAQQYADMYSSNPSIFDPKKYGQKNIQALQSMKPDAAYTQQQQVQGDIANRYKTDKTFASDVQAEQTKTPQSPAIAQTTRVNQENQINQRMIDAMNSLPVDDAQKAWKTAALTKITGVSPDVAAANAKHLKAVQDQQDLEDNGEEYAKAHPEVLTNPTQTAADIRSGKIPIDISGGLISKYPMLQGALQLYDHQEDQKHQMEMLNAKAQNNEELLQQKTAAAEAVAKNKAYQTAVAKFTDSYNKIAGKTGAGINESTLPVLQQQLTAIHTLHGDPENTPILSLQRTPGIGGAIFGPSVNTGHQVLMFGQPNTPQAKPVTSFKDILPSSSTVTTPKAGASPQASGITQSNSSSTSDPKVTSIIQSLKGGNAKFTIDDVMKDSRLTPEQKQAIQAGLAPTPTGNQ